MERLIESGLRFGELLHVREPHLVERYNLALTAFGLPKTELSDFYIDGSGYSAEIAIEIDNQNYLDPQGVNQRFIILTPEQRNLPLISPMFSASETVMRKFFAQNSQMIDAITLRDCLYGEVENLVYDVRVPADLLGILDVEFLLHSTGGLIEDALRLQQHIAQFSANYFSWRDHDLMRTIVLGAQRCGDVRHNGMLPTKLTFKWPAVVHTHHFGGAFIFRNEDGFTFVGDEEALRPLPDDVSLVGEYEIDVVRSMLESEEYIEPFNVGWLKESGVLDHRLRLLLAHAVRETGADFDLEQLVNPDYLNPIVTRFIDILEPYDAFRSISEMRSLVSRGGDAQGYLNSLKSDQQFLFLRALPDIVSSDEINLMMTRHLSFDLLSHYILDKRGFYDRYAEMDERMKMFSVSYLTQHYAPQTADSGRRRASVREQLFGNH
jgi:hypothetical protein